MLAALWASDDRPSTTNRAPNTRDSDRTADDLRDAILNYLQREIADAYLRGDAQREETLHNVLLTVVEL